MSRREFALALALTGCGRPSPQPATPTRRTEAPRSNRTPPRPTSLSPPAAPTPRTEASSTRDPDWPLFRHFPRLREVLARVKLAELPTPVTHAAALGERLGGSSLYLKRDDLTAQPYGGGKTRKLELFLGEALRQQRQRLVTSGAVGSNHAVATAIYGQRFGLETTLLLMPQPPSSHVRRNLLADFQHGAELKLVGSQSAVAATVERLVASAPAASRPYVIPAGGTSPLGNLAYVNAALELEDQIHAGLLPEPDRIYVALGTMGCAVGLELGLRLTTLRSRLVAVRVSNVPTSTQARFDALLRSTVAQLQRLDPSVRVPARKGVEPKLQGGYLGRGYAQPTSKGRRALGLVRRHSEIELELTYTAKTFAAVVDRARQAPDECLLFWHTHSHSLPEVGKAQPRDLPRAFRAYFPRASHGR